MCITVTTCSLVSSTVRCKCNINYLRYLCHDAQGTNATKGKMYIESLDSEASIWTVLGSQSHPLPGLTHPMVMSYPSCQVSNGPKLMCCAVNIGG
ncbi:hypothetical protein AG1IA_08852 [Rhizoctonia solani AG-1 IA]|uniref:Uncharacterized protein n=1 Tax=Thanatephorus cucumeris (strain AG1-IA) TaxID=983506 RepID=L8WGN4_THACA|nr:hypothetical protein AG1IA_08852 [Rhizoctonia solani AG-1 IA]